MGQTYMHLEESFRKSTKPIPAKLKGISFIGKYEFGPYKVISGKQGWTKTTSQTDFWSGNTRSESVTKSSFVLRGIAEDTVRANIAVTSTLEITEQYGFVFRTLTGWSHLDGRESEVYLADYSTSKESTGWNLILSYPGGDGVVAKIETDFVNHFMGTLASDKMSIDIVPEFRWENGKKASIFKPLEAYKFLLEGETIAAVQVYPLRKMFVWIKDDLSNNMKNVLAACSTTMMMRSVNADNDSAEE